MTGFRVEAHGDVLEIVLDRPKANAIDSATSLALNQVLADFNVDPRYRVAIFTGEGRFFCAGGDLKEMHAGQNEIDYGPNGFAGLTHFKDLTKPVIAAVNGLCVGGGFELVLACDLVVASVDARFMLSEAKIGTVPYLVSVERLLKKAPFNIGLEMLYTAREMSAAELQACGLVNSVAPGDCLRSTARQIAERVVASGPLSVAALKSAAKAVEGLTELTRPERGERPLAEKFASVMSSMDAKEGARAFVEKRPPRWQGR